jgi:hypothetical protein
MPWLLAPDGSSLKWKGRRKSFRSTNRFTTIWKERPMAINDDIKAAIDKNLSTEVGDVLKKRLELVDSLEKKLAAEVKLSLERVERIAEQTKVIERAGDLDKKAQELKTKDAEVTSKLLRAEIVALKEEHAKERVAEMRNLVALVFQNNQFKYTLTDNGYLPVPMSGGGYTNASHQRTITGQGEGAPPPAPGDVSR